MTHPFIPFSTRMSKGAMDRLLRINILQFEIAELEAELAELLNMNYRYETNNPTTKGGDNTIVYATHKTTYRARLRHHI